MYNRFIYLELPKTNIVIYKLEFVDVVYAGLIG